MFQFIWSKKQNKTNIKAIPNKPKNKKVVRNPQASLTSALYLESAVLLPSQGDSFKLCFYD